MMSCKFNELQINMQNLPMYHVDGMEGISPVMGQLFHIVKYENAMERSLCQMKSATVPRVMLDRGMLRRDSTSNKLTNIQKPKTLSNPLPKSLVKVLPNPLYRSRSKENELPTWSADVIDIRDEPVPDAAELEREKEAARRAELRRVCIDIRTPQTYLEDLHVDKFINLVNLSGLPCRMISTLYAQNIAHYRRRPEEAHLEDVQIIFEGQPGQNVGHYICIHYRPNQIIYIYDSLNRGIISSRTQAILNIRYPGYLLHVFIRSKTMQPDFTSCGVFAIAYATALIFHENPATYPLLLGTIGDTTMTLRNHLASILQQNQLSMFPRDPYVCACAC